MRIDASQTDDAALLSSEVRRLDAALDDATAEIARLRAEVERWRSVASPALGRIRCGAEACAVPALTDHDGAPAATAKTGMERRDNPPARPADGTGNAPALTEAEREALTTARDAYELNNDDDSCARIAAAIDGLLARLVGER